MPKYSKEIIRILGIIFIIYGGVEILLKLKSVWLNLRFLFYPSYNTIAENIFYTTFTLLDAIILPSGVIIAGIGLLKQKKWGWILAVVMASITFILSALSTIIFIVQSYRYKDIPIPPIPVSAEVFTVSMIPTYITCIVSLIIIILLYRKYVKQPFS